MKLSIALCLAAAPAAAQVKPVAALKGPSSASALAASAAPSALNAGAAAAVAATRGIPAAAGAVAAPAALAAPGPKASAASAAGARGLSLAAKASENGRTALFLVETGDGRTLYVDGSSKLAAKVSEWRLYESRGGRATQLPIEQLNFRDFTTQTTIRSPAGTLVLNPVKKGGSAYLEGRPVSREKSLGSERAAARIAELGVYGSDDEAASASPVPRARIGSRGPNYQASLKLTRQLRLALNRAGNGGKVVLVIEYLSSTDVPALEAFLRGLGLTVEPASAGPHKLVASGAAYGQALDAAKHRDVVQVGTPSKKRPGLPGYR